LKLAFILLGLGACNSIDGADQYKTGDAAADVVVVCDASCVTASGACLADCASTRDACKNAPSCNPGCQNKCDSDYSNCTSACVSACTACACTASACQNATPPSDAGADAD
jgi:hypothetical protein